MKIFDLPRDELVLVLAHLSPRDVVSLLSTCRVCRDLFEDDELWHCLASELFRAQVDVLRLVTPQRKTQNSNPLPIPGSGRRGGDIGGSFRSSSPGYMVPSTSTPRRSGSPFDMEGTSFGGTSHWPSGRITSFKEAYMVLKRLSGLQGLWRVIGEGDGQLVSFDWCGEQMVGQQLAFVGGTGRPDYVAFCSIRPSLDVMKSVQWEGRDAGIKSTVGIWTNDERDANPYTPERGMASQASMDAAEVGFGTPRSLSSRDSPLTGASPENSFRQAWSQFMSSSVQARSKMRRRPSRNRFAQLRHLKRVEPPKPSKRHPMAGIWVAEIDDEEFEVITVSYDFRSTDVAMIVGTKLAGVGFHEQGATIWKILAAQHTDWDPEEIGLFNRFKEYANVNMPGEGNEMFGLEMGMQALDLREPSEPLPQGFLVGRSSYFSLFDEDRDDDGMWPVRLYVLNDTTLGLFFVDDNEAIIIRRLKL